jgi:NADH dehydrogenase [ubiquinone] 1 alpha subcomplex assembly factor 5
MRFFQLICLKQIVINNKIGFSLNARNTRLLSTVSSVNIFDRNAKRLQKEISIKLNESQIYDYLKDEIAFRVCDRIYDIKRRFPLVVDFGSHKGFIGKHLTNVKIY